MTENDAILVGILKLIIELPVKCSYEINRCTHGGVLSVAFNNINIAISVDSNIVSVNNNRPNGIKQFDLCDPNCFYNIIDDIKGLIGLPYV